MIWLWPVNYNLIDKMKHSYTFYYIAWFLTAHCISVQYSVLKMKWAFASRLQPVDGMNLHFSHQYVIVKTWRYSQITLYIINLILLAFVNLCPSFCVCRYLRSTLRSLRRRVSVTTLWQYTSWWTKWWTSVSLRQLTAKSYKSKKTVKWPVKVLHSIMSAFSSVRHDNMSGFLKEKLLWIRFIFLFFLHFSKTKIDYVCWNCVLTF